MQKIAIVCGGTGGHIYPALAVAEHLPKKDIFFLGTAERLEAKLVTREGYAFHTICSSRNDPLTILKGLLQAVRVLLTERPTVILSTGGYVTIPVILAGTLLRIPIYLQEQNILPGKVNRLLSFFAKKIFYAFPGSAKYFPKKGILTGNPVRNTISVIDRSARALAPATRHFELLVIGGSLGAQALDEAVQKIDLAALHCTLTHLNKNNYVHDMAELYKRTDLVVCRAGATTLAELAVCGIPAILIPYPLAANDHQRLNAQEFAEHGAAIILEQKRLSPELLTSIIKTVLETSGQLQNMAKAMKELGRPDAAAVIARYMKEETLHAAQ